MTVVAMCDSYAGVDTSVDVEFKGTGARNTRSASKAMKRFLSAESGSLPFRPTVHALAAYTPEEKPREVFVHPDDVKLDEEPTLFQQMLGKC